MNYGMKNTATLNYKEHDSNGFVFLKLLDALLAGRQSRSTVSSFMFQEKQGFRVSRFQMFQGVNQKQGLDDPFQHSSPHRIAMRSALAPPFRVGEASENISQPL